MEEFDNTTKDKGLDPSFFLPPNVIDLRYSNTNGDSADGEEDGGPEPLDTESPPMGEVLNDEGFGDLSSPEVAAALPIPEGLTIVSQTVRTKPGGGYVVDVVVDVTDMPGIENFDLAVTKV